MKTCRHQYSKTKVKCKYVALVSPCLHVCFLYLQINSRIIHKHFIIYNQILIIRACCIFLVSVSILKICVLYCRVKKRLAQGSVMDFFITPPYNHTVHARLMFQDVSIWISGSGCVVISSLDKKVLGIYCASILFYWKTRNFLLLLIR